MNVTTGARFSRPMAHLLRVARRTANFGHLPFGPTEEHAAGAWRIGENPRQAGNFPGGARDEGSFA
jgi:hypothetical protein